MPKKRTSPREQADECRANIEQAKADKLTATTKAARKDLNQRIHMLEGIEEWLLSRTGYE